MSYKARVTDQRLDGDPPDRYFRCEVQVVEAGTTNVVARGPVNWRMRGPRVDQDEVQRYVDRQKEAMLSDVREAASFDPTAIT